MKTALILILCGVLSGCAAFQTAHDPNKPRQQCEDTSIGQNSEHFCY